MRVQMKDGWPVVGTVVGSVLHCWVVRWDNGTTELVARANVRKVANG